MGRALDLVEKCTKSRMARQERYSWLRLWATRGSDIAGPPARFNKLNSHLDRLVAHLYSADSARFYLSVPPKDRSRWLPHADIAKDQFTAEWRDSGSDVLFREVVRWALAYGTGLLKITPDEGGHTTVSWVPPGDFGVLREDVTQLDRQEVITHHFYLTVPEVKMLVQGQKDEKKIVELAEKLANPEAQGTQLPDMMNQVITTNITGTFPNQSVTGVTNLTAMGDDRPESTEPLVELVEVWEKADFKTKDGARFDDYWVTTTLGEYEILTRRNPVLPHMEMPYGPDWEGELPFIALVPIPLLDYFWGQSALTPLIQLQQWRESRFKQIDRLFELQLDPPRAYSGYPMAEEKMRAMRSPGSFIASPQPNAKVETLKPEMPQEPMGFIHELDRMFDEAGNLTETNQGEGTQGVRAGNQLSKLSRLGGAPIRSQALLIEDALEVLGTRMFHLMQRRDDNAYPIPESEKTFLLSQLPVGTSVKVSAHSSSPIYADEVAQKAAIMLKAGAIDLPTFVELMDPPMKEMLVDRARVLQANKAKQSERMMEIQEMKAQKKPSR